MELLIVAAVALVLGMIVVGLIVWLVMHKTGQMADKVLDQNAKCLRAVEQTNRSMQASLIAYHTDHPGVAATASRTLAEHMVRLTEDQAEDQGPEKQVKNSGGVTMRAGIE